uniref:hypothetical protein n=1 Tax=Algoriphagus locisalis TaxID=305507 RepID=UPI0011134907|nr:hypothetical protein [Algoriphagus locisalis]
MKTSIIDLLPFLLQRVACRIHRLGEYAQLVCGSVSSPQLSIGENTYYLLPVVHGIAAVDRLYPLKPKNPI